MKRHIKFPSIGQFRNTIQTVKHFTTYMGRDENNEPIFDTNKKLPESVKASGTVKIHGTNAGVSYSDKDGIWYQSRNQIITPEGDNMGFATFGYSKKEVFLTLFNTIAAINNISLDDHIITIFGEWAGKEVQRGVALSQLEQKTFFIFGILVSGIEPELDANGKEINNYWVDCKGYSSASDHIRNIYEFPTYSIDIDFNHPEKIQNELTKLTKDVEQKCPVGDALNLVGIGEGIVWEFKVDDRVYRFKVKGEKHSTSKVKTLVELDPIKLQNIEEFIEYAVTENRFKQGIQEVYGEKEPTPKKLGQLIKWMNDDIHKEETDVLTKNDLEFKDVAKHIANQTRKMFFNKNC